MNSLFFWCKKIWFIKGLEDINSIKN
jgi:hypothetical protein